jgi:DNA-binding MarR family transcriptional regulator
MSSESSDHGQPFLGALMRHSWQWVWDQIVAGVLAAGYDDVTAAHIRMFRYPSLDGQRPTELADQLQITKQSVNDLLGHLERAGYITRQPEAADQQIAELLGARAYTQLRDALEELSSRIAACGAA